MAVAISSRRSRGTLRTRRSRITSYNVCYTKLLRPGAVATEDVGIVVLDARQAPNHPQIEMVERRGLQCDLDLAGSRIP